jgi:hypothetical protein
MSLDAMPPQAGASTGVIRRIGILSARSWQAKLYAMAVEAAGLRPKDVAAAERAYRAGIAAPGTTRFAGVALLRLGVEPSSLVLSVFWWDGPMLRRDSRLLPGCGSAPRRLSNAGEQIGNVDEVLLMAREAAAWRRHVLDADLPSIDASLAECRT